MLGRLSVRCGLVPWFVLCGGISAWGQENWGSKMFDRQTVEFGSVAKGADCKLRIKIKNVYQETIQITSVNTSCACFRAGVVDDVKKLASNQTAEIEINVNTVNYEKKRDATMTVHLYEPTKGAVAEVRLPLHAYIRTDVVFSPGAVNFGTVDVGAGSKQLIKVAYAGRPDWHIREVKSSNDQISAEARETGRGNGLVNYDLLVEVKPGAPAGAVRDHLTLITDDANNPQVPLLVYGNVEADITLTPNVLAFGNLTPGETRTVPLVLRGRKPIAIEKIEREKADESLRVKLPEDAKVIHKVPITIVAPDEPGAFDEVLTITITGRSEPITIHAQGRINAPASSSAN
jgi:hypothetical protein